MVCVDDLSYTLTFSSVVFTLWYIAVWLPDNAYIVKSIFSFVATSVIMGLLSNLGILPDSVLDSPLFLFLTFASIFLTLILMSMFLGGIVSLAVSLVFIGPGVAVLDQGINEFSVDTIGSALPPLAVIIAILVTVGVLVVIYFAFKNSTWFHIAYTSVLLSIGLTVALRMFVIRSTESTDEFCCASDDWATCPIYGAWWMMLVFALAIGGRLLLEWQWRKYGNWFFIHFKDRERDKTEKEKAKIRKEFEAKYKGKKKSAEPDTDESGSESKPLLLTIKDSVDTTPIKKQRSNSRSKPKKQSRSKSKSRPNPEESA